MNESKLYCKNCTQEHLVLDKKQVSIIVSGLLLCSFLLFLIGYFLGKHKAFEEFSSLSKENIFNNQMHYALAKLQDIDTKFSESKNMTEDASLTELSVVTNTAQNSLSDENIPLFQAQLISFGSLIGAQEFAKRLQRNGINTTIVKHAGKVPRSKESSKILYWYQVVIDGTNFEELKQTVKVIKQIVKLNDVRIIKVNNGSTSRKIDQKQAI